MNVRAEHKVRRLHAKLDALRDAHWAELVQMEHEQITLLTQLVARYQSLESPLAVSPPPGDPAPPSA